MSEIIVKIPIKDIMLMKFGKTVLEEIRVLIGAEKFSKRVTDIQIKEFSEKMKQDLCRSLQGNEE